MSITFGRLFQLGYVVDDIDKAVHYWTKIMGVGPFFHYPTPIPFISLKYYGQEVREIVHETVLMGYSGEIQIELIQASKTAPSVYRDYLERGGRMSDIQHFGYLADDLEAQRAAAEQKGLVAALEGLLPASRFCYLANPALPEAPLVELVEMKPERVRMFDAMRLPSLDWDGRDPVRQL